MGYAKADQKGMGLHLRQFARAYILDDGNQRLVFVSVDVAMMGHGVRMEVSDQTKTFSLLSNNNDTLRISSSTFPKHLFTRALGEAMLLLLQLCI